MIVSQSPAELATLYADIGRELLAQERQADAFAAITATAVSRVPGAQWASITRGRDGSFVTIAATDPKAHEVDAIQYELGSGPCVDSIVQERTFQSGELGEDPQWPQFGRRASEAIGVRSMLSFRLFAEEDDIIAGLNLYSTRAAAFGEDSELIGSLLATHGALALAAASARERVAQLQLALESNRAVGVAMGVLMAIHKVTSDQAFDLLRIASQSHNQKLKDIAALVADTGTLDLPLTRRGRAEARRPSSRNRPVPGPPPGAPGPR